MKIASDEIKEYISISNIIGIVFKLSTIFFLILMIGGWLILYAGLKDLNKELENVRQERIVQMDNVKSIVNKLDVKLEFIVIKLQHVEELARNNAESVMIRDRELDNLERRVSRLRRETRQKIRENSAPAHR